MNLFSPSFDLYGVRSTLYDYQNGVAIYVDSKGEPCVYLAGNSDGVFVGVFKGENGMWSSKMENETGDKTVFKNLISSVMNMLPEGAKFYEHSSVSVDGLRVLAQQLKHGFVRSGETFECGLNGADKGNALGEKFKDNGDFKSIYTKEENLQHIREVLKPYMEALGMSENDIRLSRGKNGKVLLTLPVLIKEKSSEESKTSERVNETQSQSESKTQTKVKPNEESSHGKHPNAEGSGNDAKSVRMRKAAERVAEKLGTKIVWDETIEESNGYYDKKTNTIHIAKDAEHPLSFVFGHESLHRVRSLSEGIYKTLLDAVKKFVGEEAFKELTQKKYKFYNDHKVKISMDGAAEEVVADVIGMMIHNKEYAEELAYKLSHPVLSAIKEVLRQIKSHLNQIFGHAKEHGEIDNLLRTIDKAYKRAVKEADRKPLKTGEDILAEDGTVAAQVDGELNVRPSLRTYNDWTDNHGVEHQGTRGRMVEFLTNKGFDKKDIDRMTEDMDYWHGLMQKVADFVDEKGEFKFPAFHEWSQSTPLYRKYEDSVTRAVSTLVNNGEYPLNFELTTDCIKREAFTQILNEMLNLDDAAWRKLSPAKISDIQTLEKSYGIQVACPLCFVEGKRLNIMKWATAVVKKWNQAVADVTGDKNLTSFGFGKGTYVPEKPFRDGDGGQNIDLVNQVNEVDRIINSREGVLPDVLQQMKQNDEELRQKLEEFRDEYAVKHGSIDGFTLTNVQEAELRKLRNRNLKSATARMAKAIAAHPELRHKLQVEDLVGSKGLMAIRTQNSPAFAEMYSLIVSANGTGTPKIVQDAQAYDGEILDVSDSKFNKASYVGGARLFSFSDFDLTKVFDIMQIMWDCAARDAKVQSYSKEVPYILLFGKCGVKINMSMLPEARPSEEHVKAYKSAKKKAEREKALHAIKENAGLEMGEDGRIKGMQLSDSHSVSKEFAESIFHNNDYNANCGAIMVGISVNHTIYSMCQDFIRQVIPFHLSGMPIASRKKSDCIYYRDATNEQNTGYMVDGKRVKLIGGNGKSNNPKVDSDFNFYEGEDQPGWNMRDRCREYIKWCQENDCIPRFEYLVNSDGYRAFCEREGYKPNEEIVRMMDERTTDGVFDEYYKVITDYTAYQPIFDENGKMIGERPAPHKAVSKDLNIDKNALSMVLGVDEHGNMVDDHSMLANREQSIANTNQNKREIAQKAVMILNGTAKVGDLVNKGGTEFENNSDSDKFLESTGKKYSLRENDEERRSIIENSMKDGSYMKAPNGKDSNLDEDSWVNVRTKNFKNWFGDWENDPENASKVVDENGEPMVVYHDTNSTEFVNVETGEKWADLSWKERQEWEERDDFDDYWEERPFYTFDNTNYGRRSIEMPAFFFTPNYDQYHEYGERTIAAFLNLRNPIKNPDIPNAGKTDTAGEDAMNHYIEQGYDGFIREYDGKVEEVNAFFPNQIKSAEENNGDYSRMDDDIRYRTSEDLNKEYGSRWIDEQTNEDGRHTTQVKNTINSYKKFGDWVKRDSNGGKVDVLDASSGLGLGTEWMRENGINAEDVEPYPSDNRKAPTYTSYDDVQKKYDYIISNAVLNVIPDDWRANVLHNMADKLKVGGKLVINVRSAESIRKQGKEGETRITLDDPSEILVLRPNGSIKAYQKGFTKAELKEWCEKELGDGYSVEIANNKNAGGSYDTAVVVTRNNESGTIGVASEAGHPSWSAQALPSSDAKIKNNQKFTNNLSKLSERLSEGEMGKESTSKCNITHKV